MLDVCVHIHSSLQTMAYQMNVNGEYVNVILAVMSILLRLSLLLFISDIVHIKLCIDNIFSFVLKSR